MVCEKAAAFGHRGLTGCRSRRSGSQVPSKSRNGGKSLDEIVHHAAEDSLVGWGWQPGAGRTPRSGNSAGVRSPDQGLGGERCGLSRILVFSRSLLLPHGGLSHPPRSMSAFRGKPDSLSCSPTCPLMTQSGHDRIPGSISRRRLYWNPILDESVSALTEGAYTAKWQIRTNLASYSPTDFGPMAHASRS